MTLSTLGRLLLAGGKPIRKFKQLPRKVGETAKRGHRIAPTTSSSRKLLPLSPVRSLPFLVAPLLTPSKIAEAGLTYDADRTLAFLEDRRTQERRGTLHLRV
jgi:hypothetical protein